jgi:hypothetical protein
MATDVLVSRELKSLEDELSAAKTQRAANPERSAATSAPIGPPSDAEPQGLRSVASEEIHRWTNSRAYCRTIRASFAPETISSERNERDQYPTKILQNQQSPPLSSRSQRSGCRFESCLASSGIN